MSKKADNLDRYFSAYDLEQDPFPVETVDDTYYAISELEHRLELTQHLINFSDRILLFTGDSGLGKTAFLNRLSSEAEQHWVLSRLDITGGETQLQILESLFQQNQLDFHAGLLTESALQQLSARFENNIQNGFKNVLLVDDAQLLTASALNLLLLLNRPTTNDQVVHLVIMSSEDISSLLVQQENDYLHKLELPLLSEEQTFGYIRHRMRNAEPGFDQLFKPDQLKNIYKTSGGNPGLINQLAARSLQDPSIAGQQKQTRSALSFATALLDGRVTIIISLLLVTAFVVVVLNQETEETKEKIDIALPQTQSTPPQPPKAEVIRPEADEIVTIEEPGKRPNEYLDETAEPAEDLPAPMIAEQNRQPIEHAASATAEPVEVPVVAEPSATVEPEPESPVDTVETIAATSPEPELIATESGPEPASSEPKPAAQNTSGFKGADWLKQQAASKYVLQLIGAHDPDVINKLLAANPSIYDKVARFTTVNDDKRWYVLVYGLFDGRDQAAAHVPKLPKGLQALGPWPRSIASIQQDL